MTLIDKYNTYIKLIKSAQDSAGFIESDKCDSLLFTGLVGCSGDVKVNIKAAYDINTEMWNRRPLFLPPCFNCKYDIALSKRLFNTISYAIKNKTLDKDILQEIFEEGNSSISKDMFIGLAWYCYFNKRADIVQSILTYYFKHFGMMGKGTPTRAWMTPTLAALYAQILYKLNGKNYRLLRMLPVTESKGLIGFEAHLQVLAILLRKELTGIDSKQQDILKAHAIRQPNNPLFQFAVDRPNTAEHLLLDEQLWPSDRLPTEKDRAESWLFQRDYGDDWKPSNGNKIHSGGDFVFLSYLILRKRGDL